MMARKKRDSVAIDDGYLSDEFLVVPKDHHLIEWYPPLRNNLMPLRAAVQEVFADTAGFIGSYEFRARAAAREFDSNSGQAYRDYLLAKTINGQLHVTIHDLIMWCALHSFAISDAQVERIPGLKQEWTPRDFERAQSQEVWDLMEATRLLFGQVDKVQSRLFEDSAIESGGYSNHVIEMRAKGEPPMIERDFWLVHTQEFMDARDAADAGKIDTLFRRSDISIGVAPSSYLEWVARQGFTIPEPLRHLSDGENHVDAPTPAGEPYQMIFGKKTIQFIFDGKETGHSPILVGHRYLAEVIEGDMTGTPCLTLRDIENLRRDLERPERYGAKNDTLIDEDTKTQYKIKIRDLKEQIYEAEGSNKLQADEARAELDYVLKELSRNTRHGRLKRDDKQRDRAYNTIQKAFQRIYKELPNPIGKHFEQNLILGHTVVYKPFEKKDWIIIRPDPSRD